MSSGRYLVDVKGGVHCLEIPRSASQNYAFHCISFTFGDSQCQACFYCLNRCLKDLMATKVFMNNQGALFTSEGQLCRKILQFQFYERCSALPRLQFYLYLNIAMTVESKMGSHSCQRVLKSCLNNWKHRIGSELILKNRSVKTTYKYHNKQITINILLLSCDWN